MIPVFQTRFGEPEGNCFAACVASILECELWDLPDFNDQPKDRNWVEWFNEGMVEKGVSIFYAAASPEQPFPCYIPKGFYFIASGPGKRGVAHSVVMGALGAERQDAESLYGHTDELAHDPFPKGDGIEKLTSICLVLSYAPRLSVRKICPHIPSCENCTSPLLISNNGPL